MRLAQLFRRDSAKTAAVTALYQALVGKARDLEFYTVLGVPDTVNGRFDMIVIHAMSVIRRLRGGGRQADAVGEALLDLMFKDMDRSLRELGVGDMSVGKHVKRMAKAFYGRAAMYEAGLDGDGGALRRALTENLYRHQVPSDDALAGMANYLHRLGEHAAKQPLAEVIAGRIDFSVPVKG